jgi:hypothetical protein
MKNSSKVSFSMTRLLVIALVFVGILAPRDSSAQRTRSATSTAAVTTTTNTSLAVVSKKNVR